jgi:hypothetical protein
MPDCAVVCFPALPSFSSIPLSGTVCVSQQHTAQLSCTELDCHLNHHTRPSLCARRSIYGLPWKRSQQLPVIATPHSHTVPLQVCRMAQSSRHWHPFDHSHTIINPSSLHSSRKLRPYNIRQHSANATQCWPSTAIETGRAKTRTAQQCIRQLHASHTIQPLLLPLELL